jgi:hypothetical protein
MRGFTLPQLIISIVAVSALALLGLWLSGNLQRTDPAPQPAPRIIGIDILKLSHAGQRAVAAAVQVRKLALGAIPEVRVEFRYYIDNGSNAAPLTHVVETVAQPRPASEGEPCDWFCFTASASPTAADLGVDDLYGFDTVEVIARVAQDDGSTLETRKTFVFRSPGQDFAGLPEEKPALAFGTAGLGSSLSFPGQALVESCTCGSTGNELRVRLPYARRFPTDVAISSHPLGLIDDDGDGLRDGVCAELESSDGQVIVQIPIGADALGSSAFYVRGPGMGGANAPASCVQLGSLDDDLTCVVSGLSPPAPDPSRPSRFLNCLEDIDPECNNQASAALAISAQALINGIEVRGDDKLVVAGPTSCHN